MLHHVAHLVQMNHRQVVSGLEDAEEMCPVADTHDLDVKLKVRPVVEEASQGAALSAEDLLLQRCCVDVLLRKGLEHVQPRKQVPSHLIFG